LGAKEVNMEPRFSLYRRLMHWLTVVLILGLAVSGMFYSNEIGGKTLLIIHQIFGQTFIILLAFRLFGLVHEPADLATTEHPAWERLLSKTVHILLYAVMIAYLVTGFVAASGLRDPYLFWSIPLSFARSDMAETLTEVHFFMKLPLLVLLSLHISAVLKHALWDKDNTFRDMWFIRR
jgi:cytochrome b561